MTEQKRWFYGVYYRFDPRTMRMVTSAPFKARLRARWVEDAIAALYPEGST